jgi:hypothetical protein
MESNKKIALRPATSRANAVRSTGPMAPERRHSRTAANAHSFHTHEPKLSQADLAENAERQTTMPESAASVHKPAIDDALRIPISTPYSTAAPGKRPNQIHTYEPKPRSPVHLISTSEPKRPNQNHRICTSEAKRQSRIHPIHTHESKPCSPAHLIHTSEAKPRNSAHPIRTSEPKPAPPGTSTTRQPI